MLQECTAAALKQFAVDCKEHELQEELRLGYVAFTRPRHELTISSYLWTDSRKSPCGPSPYQQTARSFLEALVASGALAGPLPEWPPAPDR